MDGWMDGRIDRCGQLVLNTPLATAQVISITPKTTVHSPPAKCVMSTYKTPECSQN